jgi:hypothetical protein
MNEQQNVQSNGTYVDMLYRCIRNSSSVENLPGLVKQVIAEEMWREHLFAKTGEVFHFDNFKDFVETHAPDGLGIKVETLLRLCRDDAEALDMIDQALRDESTQGYRSNLNRGNFVDNIHEVSSGDINSISPVEIKGRPTGTPRQAGLRKLRAHAENNETIAKLRDKVLIGEMSVNKALIEAGLRAERFTVTKDPEKAAQALRKSFNKEELEKLVALLSE